MSRWLNLDLNSDLVISGGGTMNREAAAMGVSGLIASFAEKLAHRSFLVDQGRLCLLETVEDVRSKIKACGGRDRSILTSKIAQRSTPIVLTLSRSSSPPRLLSLETESN